jgi:hypothetical protein
MKDKDTYYQDLIIRYTKDVQLCTINLKVLNLNDFDETLLSSILALRNTINSICDCKLLLKDDTIKITKDSKMKIIDTSESESKVIDD